MKQIAMLAYPDCQLLDVTGPLQVFASANELSGKSLYQVCVVAENAGPLRTNSGLSIVADYALSDAPKLDTLLVSGGRGVEQARQQPELLHWLRQQAKTVRRLGSICTGAFLLAEAGLSDGRRVVTHWSACDRLAARFPTLSVEPDALYIRDGDHYSSAGVTAGIDLALSLVEEDLGHELTMSVARELVVFMKRPGGQSQFSTRLKAQQHQSSPLATLLAYVHEHIQLNLSVEHLAEVIHITPRHLSRLFAKQMGCSPAAYVEQVRLEYARQQLEVSQQPLDLIASESGFRSADRLRRVFSRSLGISPSQYRQHFHIDEPRPA